MIKKNLLLIVLLASMFNVTHMQAKVLMHDVMIFNNASEETPKGAIAHAFNLALCQKVSPIIAHSHLLKLILHDQTTLNAPAINDTYEKWLEENWFTYVGLNPVSTYFLLVPKNYLEQQKKKFSELKTNGELLGFNIDNYSDTPLITWQLVKSIINTFPDDSTSLRAQYITSWFKKSDKGLWNIYISGHGGLLSLTEDKIPQLFAQKRYTDVFDLQKYHAIITGLDVLEFRKLLTFFNGSIKTNFFYYDSCFAGGYNLYLPYISTIMNYGVIQGGSLKPKFTIAVGSSTDAITYSTSPGCFIDKKAVDIEVIPPSAGFLNFVTFFKRLKEYSENYFSKGLSSAARFSDEELRNILKPIIGYGKQQVSTHPEDTLGLLNMPQVMFPGTERFAFFPLEPEKIVVLSQAKIQAARMEHGTIAIPMNETTKSPDAIAMPVADMPIDIVINRSRMPALFSLLPGIGLHTIKSLTAKQMHLGVDLIPSLVFVPNKFPKYFYIQNLNIEANLPFSEYAELSHVLIGVLEKTVALFFVKKDAHDIYYMTTQHAADKFGYREAEKLEVTLTFSAHESPQEIILKYLELFNSPALNQKVWEKLKFEGTRTESMDLFNPLKKMLTGSQEKSAIKSRN